MWNTPRWVIQPHDPTGVPHYAPRLTPQPVPDEGLCDSPLVCIRINSHWASHVGGVLQALAFRDAWQGTDEEKEAACEIVERIIDMTSCFCDDYTGWLLGWHQNAATQQSIWESQYDGSLGSIDEDAPDHFGYDTGDAPEDAPNRNEALCYAVRVMVDLICAQALEQLGDKQTAITIIGGIIGLIIGGGVGGLLFMIATSFLVGLSEEPFKDEDARENVACCIVGVLSDLPTTQNNLNTAANVCYTSPLQGNEYVIAQALRSSNFASTGNFLAFVKTLAEGLRLSALWLLEPCPCTTWEYEFFGGYGNIPEGLYSYEVGSYDAGNDRAQGGIAEVPGEAWDYIDLKLFFDFPQGVEITRIDAHVVLSATTSPKDEDGYYSIVRSEPTPEEIYTDLDGAATHGLLEFDPTTGQIDDAVLSARIRASLTFYDGQSSGKYVYCTYLKIAGVGYDPFAGA